MTEIVFVLLKIAEIGAVVFLPWVVGKLVIWVDQRNDRRRWEMGQCLTWALGMGAMCAAASAVVVGWAIAKAIIIMGTYFLSANWELAERIVQ